MVLKEINVRENLTMDTGTGTTFTRRQGCKLSMPTLVLLGAFFACTLLAVSFIVYNFATCQQLNLNHDHPLQTPHTLETINSNHSDHVLIKAIANDIVEDLRNSSVSEAIDKDVRLPRSIIPLKYNVSIIPFLMEGNFTFQGEVEILIHMLKDSKNITMHAADLIISECKVTNMNNGLVLQIDKTHFQESKQFFIIELNQVLKKTTKCLIEIKYTGIISDNLQGFYRSSYQAGNEKRWLASTQFQPTDARRAFPCFDEPALKANFTLNIARPNNMSVISNMPKIKGLNKKVDGLPLYVWDNFEESLPMSTYLVAFSISDFATESFENFAVYARSDAIKSASYALDVGPKILTYLEEFFNISYPLPKMDMIALPDFNAGAMENWGLITYRETTMLFEEGISATTNKQKVACVVGHELVHQWFGNLVTPYWWSDIWLNEGFASYMEYLVVDAIEDKWRTMDQFVVNEQHSVFILDALSSSHKISVEVGNPDEINEIFDRISYGKGAAIIRMMDHFLTSKVFRLGLKNYLSEMAYKSAEQDDLWRFLTEVAIKHNVIDKSASVKEIMDTWTLQTGFPVVTVTHNSTSHITRMEQERFIYTNESRGTEEEPQWWIPITYTDSKALNFEDTHPSRWIPRTKVSEFENEDFSTAKWFIFNIHQTGYYRMNYEISNWVALTDHLVDIQNFKKIAPTNRAQLIDDAMNLARGGYLPYDIVLNLTTYLQHEDDYVPWKAAISTFNFIDGMFVRHGDYHLFKNYLLKLLERVYRSVGFADRKDDRDMITLAKRYEILSMACQLGQLDCIRESNTHFQNWMAVSLPDIHNPISPNLRSIVYCSAIQSGTDIEWDFAYDRYLNTKVSSEKEILLSAMGCSKEPWILARYLRRALVGEDIRKQDIFRVFAAVSTNAVGQQIAFDFIRTNWDELKTHMGSSMSNLYTILGFPTRRMNTKYMLIELEDFIKLKLDDNARTVQQTVEHIKVNIDWMDRNYAKIVNWLKQQSSNRP